VIEEEEDEGAVDEGILAGFIVSLQYANHQGFPYFNNVNKQIQHITAYYQSTI